MAIEDLAPIFGDDELIMSLNPLQVAEFYKIYVVDFIENPFEVEGKKIKLITSNSTIVGLKEYQESFAHIVTRKYKGERTYMADRANRIHWIKEILLSHPCEDVKFYKWKDDQGVCKYHYWLLSKGFMVVLKDIGKDTQVVTAFCVDEDKKLVYWERYKAYSGGGECK